MDKERIKEIALANGFKLKEQPSGEMELNPYVYDFARALIDEYEDSKMEWVVKPLGFDDSEVQDD